MNFNLEMEKRQEKITGILEYYLPKEEGFQKTVLEAMNYSMRAGGKRLRPLLMLETYRMFGGEGQIIEPFMAAMEMIHTHSLIHDDLPALDNDEYRRGRRTTHIVYGEAMAILAGDALLNYAYETAVRAFEIEPGNPAIGKALQILTKKTGIYGMLGGQCVDVEAAGREISREKLDFIYRLKTSALIEASMMVGAALAGASASLGTSPYSCSNHFLSREVMILTQKKNSFEFFFKRLNRLAERMGFEPMCPCGQTVFKTASL